MPTFWLIAISAKTLVPTFACTLGISVIIPTVLVSEMKFLGVAGKEICIIPVPWDLTPLALRTRWQHINCIKMALKKYLIKVKKKIYNLLKAPPTKYCCKLNALLVTNW